MSCQSCSGCFTSSSAKETNKEKTRFQDLLNAATLVPSQDHIIPTIIAELSKNVYASHNVLVKAFDILGLEGFLQLSKLLYENKLVGETIAWADEYCQGNIHLLLETLLKDKEKIFKHCNDQAEMYELFGGHSIPRLGK